ncbi:response regulator transcription factor [Streptomyces sp. NBC_01485]|uniref:response regulator transcription factor n=1 Tax=Streptomyces sp. NBC_01485 TaxID=2903884 RepID=UPI002E2FAF5C|nr:response regulator transcription factor [Streptomyces sp. NBC_01485]
MTTPGAPISVVLVDDHTLFRDGIREILGFYPDLTVVGEAATSQAAIEQIREHRPAIVLLDIELPGGEPQDTVTRMRELSPATRIIVLSMYDRPQMVRRLTEAGVRGYLLKTADREELVGAVRRVHAHADCVVLGISAQSAATLNDRAENPLSPRESEVLEMVAQALSNSQIAGRLDLSEATVKRHLRNVFAKLGAVSRIDAVNKAVGAALISPSHRSENVPFA